MAAAEISRENEAVMDFWTYIEIVRTSSEVSDIRSALIVRADLRG